MPPRGAAQWGGSHGTARNSRRDLILDAALTLAAHSPLRRGVGATSPGRNGLIAFQANVGDDGPQIFTVRSNGKATAPGDALSMASRPCRTGRPTVAGSCSRSTSVRSRGGCRWRNLREIASDPGACLNDANYTPDGARLVFTRFDFALEVEQIWSMKTDGSDQHSSPTRRGPTRTSRPTARSSASREPPDGALFVANVDGSAPVQVSPSISVTYKHDWAPDGKHLVVSDNSDPAPDEAVNVVTVRPDGSDWTYLTHYPAGFRANVGGYSPDGSVDRLPSRRPGPGTDDVPDPTRWVGPPCTLRVVDRCSAVHRLGPAASN